MKENNQIIQKLNKLAKQYNSKTTHHINNTPKKKIKKLHIQRSQFRGLNYEKHLLKLRKQDIQR